MIEDDTDVTEKTSRYIHAREPKRRARLHRLIVAGCASGDIAKELGVTPQYVRNLVRANGFERIWDENKARRRAERPKREKIARRRWKITQPVLDEFERRGFQITRGKIADDCLIEGLKIAVFAPRKPFCIKATAPQTRYFLVQSKYLDRFVIVILPNGKKVFYFPKNPPNKRYYVPEWKMDTPEQWPLKVDFRKFKSIQHGERQIRSRKKRNLIENGLTEEHLEQFFDL